MKILMAGVLILAVFTASLCFGEESNSREGKGLSLTITTDKKVYAMGESIECTLSLQNIGKTALVVNSRLLLNYDATFPHEVLFDIVGPDGRSLEFIPLIRAGLPSSEDFTLLSPSEFIMSTFELSRDFSFDKEGKYRIKAIYENYYKPEGMTVWTGRVESNTVEIKIKK